VSAWPHRVAAITGASSGLGRELAIELARRGCDVALLARRKEALEETAVAVRGAGRRAAVVPCDVRDRAAVLDAFQEVQRALGPVDLLVAGAGISLPVSAARWDGRRVAEVFDVNLLGVVHAIEGVLPGMLERRAGRIVGISSLAAWRAFPAHAPYGASKAALNFVLESLRLELLPSGVGVTTICPGYIRTPLIKPFRFPMPFLLDADVAARRIADAVAAGKRVHAFPWPMALAVRFSRLLPGFVWDRIAGKKKA
jgi:NAD(P)-dependent dehydrogenase (short-subunit alcohol dehydrogenase family)